MKDLKPLPILESPDRLWAPAPPGSHITMRICYQLLNHFLDTLIFSNLLICVVFLVNHVWDGIILVWRKKSVKRISLVWRAKIGIKGKDLYEGTSLVWRKKSGMKGQVWYEEISLIQRGKSGMKGKVWYKGASLV